MHSETPRAKTGRFQQVRQIWSPDDWNAGFVDNKGRFRVYRPDYPGCYSGGYALGAHVVWWLKTGSRHPKSAELHHKDHDRLNDVLENLDPLTRSAHRKTHQENWAHRTCGRCGKKFRIHAWRIKQSAVRYCSKKCYLDGPRPDQEKRAVLTCQFCDTAFEVRAYPGKKRKFCSPSCSAKSRWQAGGS